MKRQSQIEESKQKIADALRGLLKSSDFKAITLSEIAAHAGVTRMTLHRHFKTKENIILYMAQKRLDEKLEQTRDARYPLLEVMLLGLEALRNLPYRSILLESRDLEVILHKFRSHAFKDQLKKHVSEELGRDPYFFHYYFGGLNAVLRAWMEDDCRVPTREMVAKIAGISRRFMDKQVYDKRILNLQLR